MSNAPETRPTMADATAQQPGDTTIRAGAGGANFKNMRVAGMAGGFALFMLGMAFAAVPLYDMFCRVTGFGGTTQRVERPSDSVLDRTVTIRFDSNINHGLAWSFAPVQRKIDVKIGENALAFYRATNTSDRTLVGTATFNVSPDSAGAYFNKMACFCFTEQVLKPGQSVEMPVSFYVDPEFAKDKDTIRLSEVTLSYTFYPVDKPSTAVATERTETKLRVDGTVAAPRS